MSSANLHDAPKRGIFGVSEPNLAIKKDYGGQEKKDFEDQDESSESADEPFDKEEVKIEISGDSDEEDGDDDGQGAKNDS